MKRAMVVGVGVACAVALIGPGVGTAADTTAGAAAVAVVRSATGATLGTVFLQTTRQGSVQVTLRASGLTAGFHGFHVHAVGICDPTNTAPDGTPAPFTTAGGHFNPGAKPHAARDAAARHVGDLGNLKADPYGLARVDFVDKGLSLSGPDSIIGKAVIIHEKADDFTTQPTGNAGGRQACGVIEAAK